MKKIIIIISIILNIFFIIYILCNDIDLKIQKKENKEIIEKLLPEEIPFYREEFQRIKIDDSFFNIEFINDNNNYYNEDQQQFFSVKQQYLSYMPEYTYIKRFQTIEISGQLLTFVEFPYLWSDKKELYQCLIVYRVNLNKAFIILWRTTPKVDSKLRVNPQISKNTGRKSLTYMIDDNTEELYTNLPYEVIKELYPDYSDVYSKVEITNITMKEGRRKDYPNLFYFFDENEFYDQFILNFKQR